MEFIHHSVKDKMEENNPLDEDVYEEDPIDEIDRENKRAIDFPTI